MPAIKNRIRTPVNMKGIKRDSGETFLVYYDDDERSVEAAYDTICQWRDWGLLDCEEAAMLIDKIGA